MIGEAKQREIIERLKHQGANDLATPVVIQFNEDGGVLCGGLTKQEHIAAMLAAAFIPNRNGVTLEEIADASVTLAQLILIKCKSLNEVKQRMEK